MTSVVSLEPKGFQGKCGKLLEALRRVFDDFLNSIPPCSLLKVRFLKYFRLMLLYSLKALLLVEMYR